MTGILSGEMILSWQGKTCGYGDYVFHCTNTVLPLWISTQIQVKIDTLVLGDSNLKHVANSTNVFIQAESGATFLSTKSLMGAASKQTDTSGIKTVVLHLGTNDVTSHGGVDIMLNASRAITDVENKFPDANIAICSVPPTEQRKSSPRS